MSAVNHPSISVIIPALNEADTLPETVARIGSYPDTEILLVDGGSTDGSADLARALGCRVLHARGGRGPQLACGAAAARGAWLWFVHADTRVPANWRRLLFEAQHPVASLRLAIDGDHWGLRLIEWGAQMRTAWDGIPYGDQTLWIARSLYRRAGGYEPLPLFEDVRLAERLRELDQPITRLHAQVHTSARRWQRDGWLRRTLRNWQLRWQYSRGQDPRELAWRY